MPDPKQCLNLPLGEGRLAGALYDPLLAFGLRYRHGPLVKSFAWMTTNNPESFNHSEAARWIKRRHGCVCNPSWLKRWQEAAEAWKPPEGTCAWSYVRVSHEGSAASGVSFDVQLDRVLDFYLRNLADKGVELGPVFSDPAVSGYKRPFRTRIGGKQVRQFCKPGDHLVFYELDRAGRSVSDLATLLQHEWKKNNVTPHFCTIPGLDVTTPDGTMVFHNLATIAEYQSAQQSRKMRDIFQRRRAVGLPTTGRQLGWKVVRHERGGRRWSEFEPDVPVRTIMAYIEHLRETKGLSWRQVAAKVKAQVDAGKVPGLTRKWRERKWVAQSASACYKAWKKLLKTGHVKRPAEYERARKAAGVAESAAQEK